MIERVRADPGERDRSIAAELRAQRADLAMSVLASCYRRNELTVGCEALALSFIDRFADALETHSWPAFLVWIDGTCEKHGGAASIMRLLTTGSSTLAAFAANMTLGAGAPRDDVLLFARQVGAIVERPRRCATIGAHESLDEIDVAIDTCMSRLTAFDAATADHSRAVSMWCARIAKKMALSRAETTLVKRAGLIHDIGKVTTPPAILNAPHRLSDSEMAVMRDHAAAGAAIVSGIPLLAHLTSAVRSHHERVDGRGYPDGLQGSHIPLSVRIVSVADSFNAMIGNRPYRLPMAPTAAIEQLKVHSGSQFDPNVVGAMIDVVHHQR